MEDWLQDRQQLTTMLQQQLLWAQHRMKAQADKHRSDRGFQVGDLVYLKVQPYVQVSLAPRSCQKLAFCFFGPYKILQRVGTTAYKLELPAHARIHIVVHVSQLKKHVPPDATVSVDISVILPNTELISAGWLQH
jgi:exosome complex RNA-binding protein Rrp4